MRQQTPFPAKKESKPSQMRGLLPHSAVRAIPEHEKPSNGSTETRFGHGFSRVAVRSSAPIIGQDYSKASCPMFPQRFPFGGACHTCPPRVQAKLMIGRPENKYEQEADQVTGQAIRMPIPAFSENSKVTSVTRSPHLQPSYPKCEEELQPKAVEDFFQTKNIFGQTPEERNITKSHRNRVRPDFVSCRARGIWNPRITGPDVVNGITNADREAITLGRRAQNLIFLQRLTFGTALYAADADFDNALANRFGLNLNNANDRVNTLPIIERRFERASDILEGGWIRYTCRGVDCASGSFAYTDPGVYQIHLCNGFWNNPDERAGTVIHEALHIYFGSIGDTPDCPTPDISNAWCYELFTQDIS